MRVCMIMHRVEYYIPSHSKSFCDDWWDGRMAVSPPLPLVHSRRLARLARLKDATTSAACAVLCGTCTLTLATVHGYKRTNRLWLQSMVAEPDAEVAAVALLHVCMTTPALVVLLCMWRHFRKTRTELVVTGLFLLIVVTAVTSSTVVCSMGTVRAGLYAPPARLRDVLQEEHDGLCLYSVARRLRASFGRLVGVVGMRDAQGMVTVAAGAIECVSVPSPMEDILVWPPRIHTNSTLDMMMRSDVNPFTTPLLVAGCRGGHAERVHMLASIMHEGNAHADGNALSGEYDETTKFVTAGGERRGYLGGVAASIATISRGVRWIERFKKDYER